MDRQRIIEALNEDVSLELGGIMQYLWHHFMAPGVQGGAGEVFRQTALDEMRHLARLARRVAELGGEPVARIPTFDRGGDMRRMMEDDLAREKDAVQRYREHIALCIAEGDDATRGMLEQILADEERHVALWEGKLGSPVPVG